MIKQYLAIKEDHPDAILFYRMGDFYEMFFEDAETASRVLEITLTSRNKNDESPVPMCGVPHRAAATYIALKLGQGIESAIPISILAVGFSALAVRVLALFFVPSIPWLVAAHLIQTIKKAKALEVGKTDAEVLDWISRQGFTASFSKRAFDSALAEEGRCVSVWDVANGITAMARSVPLTRSQFP